MSEQGRLIINARGESAKAITHGKSVTVQATARADRCYFQRENGIVTSQVTTEVEFTRREAAAFALQILDAAGYAAEIKSASSRVTKCHGDAAIDACDTRDICERWGCRKQPMLAQNEKEC
jgi:hypothetical protein